MADILILNGTLPRESEFKSQKLTIIADKGGIVPVATLPMFSKKTVDVILTDDVTDTVGIAFQLGQIVKPGDNIISSDTALKNLLGKAEEKKRTRKASSAGNEKPAAKEAGNIAAPEEKDTVPAKEAVQTPKAEPDKMSAKTKESKIVQPVEGEGVKPSSYESTESADSADKLRENDFLKAYDKKHLPEEWKEEGKRLLKLAIDKPSLLILSGNLPKECPKEVRETIIEIIQKIKKL